MQTDITLCFTCRDLNNNNICEITVCKQHLLLKCKEIGLDYFDIMFSESNTFKEHTMDRIEIKVPYPTEMSEIIQFILGTPFELPDTCTTKITKRIHCMDFIGMDFDDELLKLLHLPVDSKIYGEIHQLIDNRGYDRELYIKFMARKLPAGYDSSDFPEELRKLMLDVDKSDFAVLYGNDGFCVYDVKKQTLSDNIVKTVIASDSNVELDVIAFNSTLPIVAVGIEYRMVFYHLIEGNVIGETGTCDSGEMVNSACFSTDGNTLYFSSYVGTLYAYDMRCNKIIHKNTFKPGTYVRYLTPSPDGNFLAFVMDIYNNRRVVCLFDLLTSKIKEIYKGRVYRLTFANANTLIFYDYIALNQRIRIHHIDSDITFNANECSKDNEIKFGYCDQEIACSLSKDFFLSYYSDHYEMLSCGGEDKENNGSIFDTNGKLIRKICTNYEGFSKSTSCIASDSDGIYTLMINDNEQYLVKYNLGADYQITLDRIIPLKLDITARNYNFIHIANVAYVDPKLATKLEKN